MSLKPGDDWKQCIDAAIRKSTFFLGCFSASYFDREDTQMNEEINIAIECLRKKHCSAKWFIPTRLEKCDLPNWKIAPGRSIADLQALDFWPDFKIGVDRLKGLMQASNAKSSQVRNADSVELIMAYLAYKGLIDNGTGRFFHNNDMGHPVYAAGAKGVLAESWSYADGPDRNLLFIKLARLSKKIMSEGYASHAPKFYDFSTWERFCRYSYGLYCSALASDSRSQVSLRH